RLYRGGVAAAAEPRGAANVLMNQFAGTGVDPGAVDAAELAELIEARDRIPRAAFLEALAAAGAPGFSAERYLAEAAISDASELEPIVDALLGANPGQVEAYRSG